MNTHPIPGETNNYLAEYVFLITQSLKKYKGVELTDPSLSMQEQARQIFSAPYVLLAHNATDDPVFQYANKKGLELFEMSWDEFTQLKSKYSAEPQNRKERELLLNEVQSKGYADNYSGIRISKTGRRFQINAATVWNIIDVDNKKIGQAAIFSDYSYFIKNQSNIGFKYNYLTPAGFHFRLF